MADVSAASPKAIGGQIAMIFFVSLELCRYCRPLQSCDSQDLLGV